ncbi:MAG: hypothetical protein C0487_03560 [Leptothrix sp. (in: Bacteria)]|nr:hypothetical protein [Leptothrix sp. (in: b-proteobacteria)]
MKRLPRWALLLFCIAYVLPGLFGRDPWKGIDIASFGHMWSVAGGQASWLHPNVGGVLPTGGGILPYWLGGAFIALLDPWLDPAFAARIPFALLLASVMSLTWYATYHLARTKAAQPLPLAFGGEALPQDYARAVADGSVLALIASLGLLQLGHETTPELLQLAAGALFMYGMAAAAFRPWQSRLATLICLPVMAASGSPTVAVELAAAGMLICALSDDAVMRSHMRWVAASGLLAAALASALSSTGLPGWALRIDAWSGIGRTLRLFTWFTWPVLPLAALTVWHWRRQVARRHIAVPLFSALVGFGACIVMDANDRALLQALPALAVLAAFALPILQRSLGSAIDWFSVFFFTTAALMVWLHYGAMHTGVPAKMAGNVAKLVPGYTADFSWPLLILGAIATAAWLALVRWRTARQSHALWKSLVLPAGGVALCWLLAMTLLLPPLDQSLSYRLLVNRIKRHVPVGTCIAAPNASTGLLTGLEYFGRYRVDGLTPPASVPRSCPVLIYSLPAKQTAPSFPGWRRVARENQRTKNSESVAIYRRAP